MLSLSTIKDELREYEHQFRGGDKMVETRQFLNELTEKAQSGPQLEGGGNPFKKLWKRMTRSKGYKKGYDKENPIISDPTMKDRAQVEASHNTVPNSEVVKTNELDPEVQKLLARKEIDDEDMERTMDPDSELPQNPVSERKQLFDIIYEEAAEQGKTRSQALADTRREMAFEIQRVEQELVQLENDLVDMRRYYDMLAPPRGPPIPPHAK